jgi:hypothetical protein
VPALEILAHRGYWTDRSERNALSAFSRAFANGWGAEVDVRDLDGRLVVSHDAPGRGALAFADVVAAHAASGAPGQLAVNVKADGLQELLDGELAASEARWFAFDMSVPDALVSVRRGLPVFTRHSDVEPVPCLYDDSVGVWLDDFAGGWLDEHAVAGHLAAGQRVAVVSPELHGRDHRPAWAEWRSWPVWDSPDVLLCTDHPAEALEVFS